MRTMGPEDTFKTGSNENIPLAVLGKVSKRIHTQSIHESVTLKNEHCIKSINLRI